MSIRLAFCGASGTGKTTLAEHFARALDIPLNPVGSRSVAAEMGFASPYDVDKAGKRAEFQRRLLAAKLAWEAEHESFVTDRTTLDNLAYTLMHDARAIDADMLTSARAGFGRYTHVLFTPIASFCSPGNDPARVSDLIYAQLYEWTLEMLMRKLAGGTSVRKVYASTLVRRIAEVEWHLDVPVEKT